MDTEAFQTSLAMKGPGNSSETELQYIMMLHSKQLLHIPGNPEIEMWAGLALQSSILWQFLICPQV